jgi:hypothetical protein
MGLSVLTAENVPPLEAEYERLKVRMLELLEDDDNGVQ